MEFLRKVFRVFFALLLAFAAFASSFASAQIPSPIQIKVLQFNAWQLKFFGKELTRDRIDRLKLIPDAVSETGADIISFTEIWKNNTKAELSQAMLERGYPYSYFRKRFLGLGDGLLVVSKHPIIQADVSPVFRPKTRWDEFIAKKRAVHAVVELPAIGPVDVYSTHLGAVTFHSREDRYDEHEQWELLGQMNDLAEFMKSSRKSPMAILAGDFNFHYQAYQGGGKFAPQFSPYYLQFIRNACVEGDLENSFLKANKMDESTPAVPTYSQSNPYVSGGYFPDIPSEVEDYIFNCPSPRVKAVRSEIAFDQPISEEAVKKYGLKRLPLRLSDHYGVLTTFEISPPRQDSP